MDDSTSSMMVATSTTKGSFSLTGATAIEVVSGGLVSLLWSLSVDALPGAVASTEELSPESPSSVGVMF